MTRLMKERGIAHPTSECTLRGFTCAQANVDPKVATPAEIARMRATAVGHQVTGVTGGLRKSKIPSNQALLPRVRHAVESEAAAAETGARTVSGFAPPNCMTS